MMVACYYFLIKYITRKPVFGVSDHVWHKPGCTATEDIVRVNPQINFCHFFYSLNLVIFWAQLLLKLMDIRYLVSATPPTFFFPILLKLYRCFCQGLKMCMTFGYNPQINFCHFFYSFNLVILWAQLLLKLMDIRYLVSATPPTIFSQSF